MRRDYNAIIRDINRYFDWFSRPRSTMAAQIHFTATGCIIHLERREQKKNTAISVQFSCAKNSSLNINSNQFVIQRFRCEILRSVLIYCTGQCLFRSHMCYFPCEYVIILLCLSERELSSSFSM